MIRIAIASALIAIGCFGVPVPQFAGAFGMPMKDRQYVADLYLGIANVLTIDKDKKISDTDRFRTFHTGCLRMAIPSDKVGKYQGLDEFIESTFQSELGTTEVLPVDESTKGKLITACQKIAKRLNGL